MTKGSERLTAIVAIAAIVVIGIVLVLNVVYYRSTTTMQPAAIAKGNITLTASGSISANPTQAVVYAVVNSTGSSAAIATANLSGSLSELNSTLSKYVSLNATTINTISYYLYRVHNSSAYAASEGVQLTLPLNVTGTVLSALSSVPGIGISGINIELSSQQASALRATALAIAMQNATDQAQAIAGVYGPVRLTNVVVGSGGIIYPNVYSAAAVPNMKVYSGTAYVTETVTATFSYG